MFRKFSSALPFRTAGDFITPALLQSCSVNLFPFSGYSFGLDVVTQECSRVIVGSIGVLSFAEALTHLIGFRASCMIGRMRTVICLLRNDLRVHDNEVWMASYWQILLFLFFPQSFQQYLITTCKGVTMGASKWRPHHPPVLL